jgi:nucleolar protein 9
MTHSILTASDPLVLESTQPNSDRDAWFETILRDQVGSHLLEIVLKTISPSLYNKIFVTYFRNRLVKLCHHPVANFVVQQLFVNARTSVQLELMVEEAVPGFADYLSEFSAYQSATAWSKLTTHIPF